MLCCEAKKGLVKNTVHVRGTPMLIKWCVAVCVVCVGSVNAFAGMHPLEPLSAEELRAVVACVKREAGFKKPVFFADVALQEPSKEALKKHAVEGVSPVREAKVVVFETHTNSTHEYVVDVGCARAVKHEVLPNRQPFYGVEELGSVPALVRKDGRWQAAMRKRGIARFEDVQIDAWALGIHDKDGQGEGRRLVRALSFYGKDARHAYWRPVEGVVVLLDLSKKKVVEVRDIGVVAVPEVDADVRVQSPTPKYVEAVSHPFVVDGHTVEWDRWRVRYGMRPREGLVVYDVSFYDEGRWRGVMHRGSLSEMVVPYGDPDASWAFRNAFDEGEYGLGRLASPLVPGKDMPKDAYYAGADFVDDSGEVYHVPRVVAVYERDSGVLWKHYDAEKGETDARMGRELWISYYVTVGNYDYGLSWVFRQDGSIEVVTDLTGILLAKGVKQDTCTMCEKPRKGEDPEALKQPEPYSTLVGRGVAAPYHQHMFNMRLDMDIEGEGNSVLQMDTRALRAEEGNVYGGGFVMEENVLRTEGEAARDVHMPSARMWKVFHPHAKTALGHLPGYVLVPQENSVTYLQPDAEIRQRAPFVNHHMYVTRYESSEKHGAGEYPNQTRKAEGGVEAYQQDNASLIDTDVVMWYTFGVTHVPRPEDWPVMPRHRTGFKLVPAGFFSRNPALFSAGDIE
jgi:primary-amine oxidase